MKNQPRILVCLTQHGGCRLLNDHGFGQHAGFLGIVSIQNTASRLRQIHDGIGLTRYRGFEPIDQAAQICAAVVNLSQSGVND